MKLFSEQQKLETLETMIRLYKESSLTPREKHELAVLKALAKECAGRIPGNADHTIQKLEKLLMICDQRRVRANPHRIAYETNALVDLAQHVIGLWPTLRAALIDRAIREKEDAL